MPYETYHVKRMIEFLEALNLVQEPPRVRTVMFGMRPVRLHFPWVSIGHLSRMQRVGMAATWGVYAYFHNRKWENLRDATNVLCLAHPCFHAETAHGYVCVGGRASTDVNQGRLTPSQAFWWTKIMSRSSSLPLSMFDLSSPDKVLQEQWTRVDPLYFG